MLTFDYVVEDPRGIHARTAGLFVREAVKHPCAVKVVCGDKEADGKSLLSLMGMKIPEGEKMTVHIDGKSGEEELRTKTGLLDVLKEN